MNQKPRRVPRKFIFIVAALIVIGGLLATSWYCMRCHSPNDPAWLAIGTPQAPYTVLLMGTDVQYSQVAPRRQVGDKTAFTGRSDTMLLVMVDPQRKTVRGLHIPRDTVAEIPGYGTQKINAANAIGGPQLAAQTVANLLNVNVDHYVVLNVQGLVDAVNELGGITVQVPKKMTYMDWTAKLKIDLEPGVHTLTGNQAMGFVRYRHDDLGDIGRIQRQQIFMHAAIAKMLNPTSWIHFPKLVEIANRNLLTDMSQMEMMRTFNLVRSVPKNQLQFAMLPGHFGSYGSWVPDEFEASRLVARMYGVAQGPDDRRNLTICLRDQSSVPGLADRVAETLRTKYGYNVMVTRRSPFDAAAAAGTHSQIIAQRGNFDDAEMLYGDLGKHGEIVNASIGDIYSSMTLVVGDDLAPFANADIAATGKATFQ